MTSPQVLYHKWLREMNALLSDVHQRRMQSFVWLLVGLFLGPGIHMKQIARKIPGYAQQNSKERMLLRVMDNGHIRVREWYQPIAKQLLQSAHQSGQMIRLIIDGTQVGNGHQLIMVALAYRRRALPILWTWRRGTRGHSPAALQIAVLAAVNQLLPEGAEVLLLGDSEFGNIPLIEQLEAWQWWYVLRQKGDHCWRKAPDGEWQRCDDLVTQPGQKTWRPDVFLTKAHAHLTNLVAVWKRGYDQPWLLATNLPEALPARRHYGRRAWIENYFGDCKGQGFDLEATRLQHFLRLSRLTLAVAILTVWLLAYGSYVIKAGLRYLVDRTDRRDHSLFRIGWEMVDRRLTNGDTFTLRLVPYF